MGGCPASPQRPSRARPSGRLVVSEPLVDGERAPGGEGQGVAHRRLQVSARTPVCRQVRRQNVGRETAAVAPVQAPDAEAEGAGDAFASRSPPLTGTGCPSALHDGRASPRQRAGGQDWALYGQDGGDDRPSFSGQGARWPSSRTPATPPPTRSPKEGPTTLSSSSSTPSSSPATPASCARGRQAPRGLGGMAERRRSSSGAPGSGAEGGDHRACRGDRRPPPRGAPTQSPERCSEGPAGLQGTCGTSVIAMVLWLPTINPSSHRPQHDEGPGREIPRAGTSVRRPAYYSAVSHANQHSGRFARPASRGRDQRCKCPIRPARPAAR